MKLSLPYGRRALEVELPDDAEVVLPRQPGEGLDAVEAIRRALRAPVSGPPLAALVRRGSSVSIAICDGTRPQPHRAAVLAVLEAVEGVVDPADVVVVVATGTHRASSTHELTEMLGADLLDAVRVVNHDARDDSALTYLGVHGDGVPTFLNSEWLAADLRVTTGFVEPHFFAGFSGGPKLVAPGLAGLETTLVLHDARRIGSTRATWGVTIGNPVHDDVRAIAAAAGVGFACDVVLDPAHRVVSAFGGPLPAMHEAAVEHARAAAMRPVAAPFDLVVTSNAGFPLDQNLYQCVKGMSAANEVVRRGGRILLAAECSDGVPDHGEFRSMLASAASPHALLEQLTSGAATVPDQWQAQILCRILNRASVSVFSGGLSDDDLADAFLERCEDIGAAVRRERSAGATRVGVLPSGPETIPYLSP